MKIKKRKHIIEKKSKLKKDIPTEPQVNERGSIVSTPCLNKFQVDIKRGGNVLVMGTIRKYYEDLFKRFPPWEKYHIELILLKIEYRLLKRDYYRAGIKMPPKIMQNYQASKAFNIDGLGKDMKAIIKCLFKKEKGDNDMPNKKKSATKKSASKTIALGAACLELFMQQEKEQRTDEQLYKALEIRIKREPHPSTVANYRWYYNHGQLTGQTKPPKIQLKSVKGKLGSRIVVLKTAKKSAKKKPVLKKKGKVRISKKSKKK